MHDPLSLVLDPKVRQIEVDHVLRHLHHLGTTCRLGNEGRDVEQCRPVGRGDVVIDGAQRTIRTPNGPIRQSQSLECLGGRDLVDQMSVYVQETRLAVIVD
jgi:hypothetical protein